MKETNSIPLPPLLELTASQLEVALQSTNAQIEQLGGSVAAFAKLGADIGTHPDAAVAELGRRVAAEAQRAMFAMQFHDQLVQRLQHVCHALGDLQDYLSAPVAPPPKVLLAAIRTRYTMEDERRLFDVMVAHLPGAPRGGADSEQESARGSVEIF